FFLQWWALSKLGLRLSWLFSYKTEGLMRIIKMMGPMTFGLAIAQMIVLVDKMVASFLYAGNISHLYYSNRLFQFPFALIAIAVGTVVLPASSEHVAKKENRKVALTARHSLKMMSFLMLPSMVGLWLIGHPLIGLLFRSGQFDSMDQNITFAVLVFALPGLFAYGCIRIFISLCYSFEDTIGPVLAGVLALFINVVLDVLFVWYWPVRTYAVSGLTLAGSFAVWGQVYILRRRLLGHLPEMWLIPWKSVFKYFFISLLMGLIVLPFVLSELSELTVVLVGSFGGVFVYFAIAHLLGEVYPRRIVLQVKDTLLSK
ncbi:MAG: murein biosynthesis integral membrane protein MurJ, partial [bacterium]